MEYDLSKLTPDVRHLDDMREVLADKNYAKNSPDTDLYFMYRGLETKSELRYDETIVFAKMLGGEFNKTKGHCHIGAYPEIYTVLKGQAIYLQQKNNNAGEIEDVFAVKAEAGESVIMKPFYGHVTINPSKINDLKMSNWIYDISKSDYSSYIEKQGSCYYYMNDNGKEKWVKNENYKNIPELRFEEPLKSIPNDLEFLKKG